MRLPSRAKTTLTPEQVKAKRNQFWQEAERGLANELIGKLNEELHSPHNTVICIDIALTVTDTVFKIIEEHFDKYGWIVKRSYDMMGHQLCTLELIAKDE